MRLYVRPVGFAGCGIAFPIGVLIYWTVSNRWTMGQQFYVIRNNPVPGTPAAQAKEDREKAKARRKCGISEDDLAAEEAAAQAEEIKPVPRVQPKKQPRSQRSGGTKKNPPKKRS